MSPLEVKRLEVQLANVRAGRMALELKIDEFAEAAERIRKDIQISLDREAVLEQQIKGKQGN